ncbi:probable inactive receptor kinase At3g08680 [Gossypium arboreum]|uniref:probable inactive receptor kinase At3g08680 n=1 Tax=Gossypium arboreum TaxID=29729 RepID=UPI0008195817|nr:probable inactive receptor kinase At3g08680 [Gossypium arboreum]
MGDASKGMNAFVRLLHTEFSLKDMGALHYFLEVEVTHSNKQQVVSHSIAEAEYKGLAAATSDVTWLVSLLNELNFCSTDVLTEKVFDGSLLVGEVPAYDQVADILTKPLSASHFTHFQQLLQVFCVSLEYLFLDANLSEGPIPPSLSSLRGLEALDVSNNNLSGGVPKFLMRFGALKYLNLFFNNFEGVIPSEGVLKNASDIFVEGNSKLCGVIPEFHLSRCSSKKSSRTFVKLKIAISL